MFLPVNIVCQNEATSEIYWQLSVRYGLQITSDIKTVYANWLTSIPPEIIIKAGFTDDIRGDRSQLIFLILVKFGDDR